jgi:hypothetical protein
MPDKKTLNLLYYFPNWKNLLVLSVVLFPLFTIIFLEFYKYEFEIIYASFLIGAFIVFPLGILLTIVLFVAKSHIKFHLWLPYIGLMSLMALFSGVLVFNRQTKLAIEKADILIQAIDRYKNEAGYYPKELKDLQGKYITEIPVITFGVFSTQQIKYSSFDGEFQFVVPTYSIDMSGAYLYDSEHREYGWYYDD